MVDENDAQKSVEEPIAISENGEAVVTSWDMWVNLCKNESLKKKVETLRLRVSDEKKGEPLEINCRLLVRVMTVVCFTLVSRGF